MITGVGEKLPKGREPRDKAFREFFSKGNAKNNPTKITSPKQTGRGKKTVSRHHIEG